MIRKLMGIFAMVCLLSTTVVAEEAAPTEEPVKIHDFNEETCMEEADFGTARTDDRAHGAAGGQGGGRLLR